MDRTSVRSRDISTSCDGESAFEAEPILPSQFFEGRHKNEPMEPEKRLSWPFSLMQCTAIRWAAMRKRPLVLGHSGKPRSGYSAQGDMVRSHSRTCVGRLILLLSISARCYANGGSEGLAELAGPQSGAPL
jgi:hypothetical protein